MTLELGLKCGILNKQLDNRLKYYPETLEFHLNWEDLGNLDKIKSGVDKTLKSGVKNVIIHHPINNSVGSYNESFIDREKDIKSFNDLISSTKLLGNLSKIYKESGKNVKTLVHISYGGDKPEYSDIGYTTAEAQSSLFKNILMINKEFGDLVIFENGITRQTGLSLENNKIQEFILKNRIPLCLDISHAYISCNGNMESLIKIMDKLKDCIHHYHIVDSFGKEHDSLVVGKGTIQWERVILNLNRKATSIYEINVKNLNKCDEMLESHLYLNNIIERQKMR